MDLIFLLAVLVLYGVSHALVVVGWLALAATGYFIYRSWRNRVPKKGARP